MSDKREIKVQKLLPCPRCQAKAGVRVGIQVIIGCLLCDFRIYSRRISIEDVKVIGDKVILKPEMEDAQRVMNEVAEEWSKRPAGEPRNLEMFP